MTKGRPIYPEEEARMVRLWQQGKTYEEIGDKVGRSAAVARHTIDRVRRREKAYGVILVRKEITRTCAYCGKEFACAPGSTKKYCSVWCGQTAKWGVIAKKCEALGMSYGEARARGLL